MPKGTTEIVVAEDNTNQPPPPPPPPPLQLPNLPNLFPVLSNFKLRLPFTIPPKPKQTDSPITAGGAGGGDPKRNFVRIPKAQVASVPPQRLEVEVEESITKTSNPVIIWQVYAIGAFFVTAWAVSRWRERSGRGKSPNDDRAE